MKPYRLLLLLLLCELKAISQVTENFNDNNFTSNPVWTGDTGSWIINSKHQLQSNDTIANSTFYLSTANALAINTAWELYVHLNFNTSAANYTDVYLIASADNLTDSNTVGYFVRIGGTGDAISLYRKDSGNTTTKIIDGINGVTNSSNNIVKIKVVRNADYQFNLLRDNTGAGNYFLAEGAVTDSTYITASFFGIIVKQSTSSFFQKHYFDDIRIQPYMPDSTPPAIKSVIATSATSIDVLFSEPVDITSSQNPTNYTVNNTIGAPVKVQRDTANTAAVHLVFATAFTNNLYAVTIHNVKDNSGNSMAEQTANFSYTSLQPKSIVINEILFNPKPNGFDYVEFYNSTNMPVDISNLYLANRTNSGSIGSLKKLSDTSFFMTPHGFVVITTDATSLQRNYLVKDAHAVISIPTLPAFPDTEGTVVLTNGHDLIVDEVHYSEDWQFALLKNPEGVSLERIDPDKSSGDKNNWHSAAATAGYGTPGYQNSQYKISDAVTATVEVAPTIFSPDNDGYDDIATVQYKVNLSGYVANITIFDAAGRPVRYLVKNDILGTTGSWNWDGLDEKRQKLPVGSYIIYTELFNLEGKKKRFKNVVVLAGKLK